MANIDGKCVSVLKGLFLNCFKMYFFNSGAFSLVGKYGNVSGRGGGGVSVCVCLQANHLNVVRLGIKAD